MWEPNGTWTFEGPSVPMVTNSTFTNEVHLLLVDHDCGHLASTARLLQLCSYKVTATEHGSTALSMLLGGKEKFDLVLADIHLADIDGFTFLREAATMGLPMILMAAGEAAMLARISLEYGACLLLPKPINVDILKCMWQFVIRDKIVKADKEAKGKELIVGEMVDENGNGSGNGSKGNSTSEEAGNESETNCTKNKDGTGSRKKKLRRIRKAANIDNDHEESEFKRKRKGKVHKKTCTEWTDDLHSKFLSAVAELGEGRCYPKEILELMEVPGLTRMQVASHLQKCRNDNWRAPETRKVCSPGFPSSSANDSHSQTKFIRKFGSMPRVFKPSSADDAQPHDGSTNDDNNNNNENNNNFQGIKNFENVIQLNSQPHVMANQYSLIDALKLNSGMPNMEFGSSSKFPNYPNNGIVFVGGLENPNGPPNGNGKGKEKFVPLQNSDQPIFSDILSNATFGPILSRTGSTNQNKSTEDYGFDFFQEFEDHQSISKILEDAGVYGVATPQQFPFDFNQVFSGQNLNNRPM